MQSISTSVIQDWTIKYICIAWIFIMLAISFFALSLMCCLKFRCWSRSLPRYLTALLTAIVSPWASSGYGDVFLSCCWEPKRMYSVLSGFSFRHIASIQHYSCVNASSRSVLVLCSSTLLCALRFLHMEWSSVNAVSVMELLIWSLMSKW